MQHEGEDDETMIMYGGTRKNIKKGEMTFASSRKVEIDGLRAKGTLVVMDRTNLPEGTKTFGLRFIDLVNKTDEEKTMNQRRLVTKNYADEEASEIATNAPTVQRFSKRVMIPLETSIPEISEFMRDVTQEYVQTKHLWRETYIFDHQSR